jgi:hypothetical protein
LATDELIGFQGAGMNWIAVGAIADALGTVAILVSLVYVALQIRQGTEQISRSVAATEFAAFERNIEAGNGIRELLILHPAVAQLFLEGCASYSGLTSLDKFRFGSLLRNMFSSAQGGYIRQLRARNDPGGSEGIGGVIDSILVNPGVQEWLAKNSPDWHPEFRTFVDERLAAIKQSAGQPEV